MDMQELDQLLKYSKFYICMTTYFDGNELVFGFLTRAEKYYKENNKYNFYDLYRRKNIKIDNVLKFEVLFSPDKINSYHLFNGLFDYKDLEPHYANNQEFINDIIDRHKKEVKTEYEKWQSMDYYSLREECYEKLFFDPNSSERPEILKKMKQRKQYLLTTVDNGRTSKILAILEITEDKLYEKDAQLVESCKNKWKNVISFYAQKAYASLDKEINNIENKEELPDLQIEVSEIKQMLDDMCCEIESKEFAAPINVVEYWPELLKPSPIYAHGCNNS
jgi:hypothetical protein